MVEKALFKIKEAAIYLSVGRSTIYELIQDGTLKRTTVLPLRVTRESLVAYRQRIIEKDE